MDHSLVCLIAKLEDRLSDSFELYKLALKLNEPQNVCWEVELLAKEAETNLTWANLTWAKEEAAANLTWANLTWVNLTLLIVM